MPSTNMQSSGRHTRSPTFDYESTVTSASASSLHQMMQYPQKGAGYGEYVEGGPLHQPSGTGTGPHSQAPSRNSPFGNMIIESQNVDTSALGMDAMLWLDYMP